MTARSPRSTRIRRYATRWSLLALLLLACALASAAGHDPPARDLATATPLVRAQARDSDGAGRRLDNNDDDIQNVFDGLVTPYALLTASPQLFDGIIGICIARSMVLTSAEWVANASSIQYAMSSGEVIKVKSVQTIAAANCSASTMTATKSASDNCTVGALLLVQLAADLCGEDISLFDALASPLTQPTVDLLSLTYYDVDLVKTGAMQRYTSMVQSTGVCASTDALSAGSQSSASNSSRSSTSAVCLQARETLLATPQPFQRGILTLDNSFIGLTTGYPRATSNSDSRLMQSVVVLSAEPYRQRLMQVADVEWDTTTKLAADWFAHQATPVLFYDASGVQIDCSGVHIAPTFVLATTSCLRGVSIASVMLKGEHVRIKAARSSLDFDKSGATISTAEPEVVILELASNITDNTVHLASRFYVPSYFRMFRIELSATPTIEWVELLPREQCDSGRGSFLLAADDECVGVRNAAVDVVNDHASALFYVDDGVSYLVGIQPRNSNRYALVRKYEFFIDALATGQKWSTLRVDKSPLPPSKQYVVGLRTSKTGRNFCGGSLISPTHVLTAAHCVADRTKIWVSVGTLEGSGGSEQLIPAVQTSVRIHPLFGAATMASFDAAILELYHAAATVPITLDGSESFSTGTVGTMFGYGSSPAGGRGDGNEPVASAIALPIWPKAQCREFLDTNYDASLLCAGGEANTDACVGDSGSPLTIASSNGIDLLAGIVSAGYNCATEGVPGVYTRIAALYDFVHALVPFAKWINVDPRRIIVQPSASSAATPTAPQPANARTTQPPLSPPATLTSAPSPGSVASPSSPPVATSDNSGVTISQPPAVREYELAVLAPVVDSKVLAFVLGTDAASSNSNSQSSSTLLTRLSDVHNGVTLYSTADISELLAVIQRRAELPLNQRTDRFGSATTTTTTTSARTQQQQHAMCL